MKQDFANDTKSFDQNSKIEDRFNQNEKLIAKEGDKINKNIDSNIESEVEGGFKEISDNPNIDNIKRPEIDN